MEARSRRVPLTRPAPVQPPVYSHPAPGRRRGDRRRLYPLLDAAFVLAGTVLSLWLAMLLLREGFSLSPRRLVYLIAFWLVFTYVALPRLHQVLTVLYLPDYFIGRTRTSAGVLSDPVNVGLDGTEEDIHTAMRRAGWVLADERTVGSAWKMVLATLLRRSYAAAPVSDLYLMGRRHDFTYQQEVGGTTSQRHHVRFWRLPGGTVLPGGHRVGWLAAGTYDRSVGFSLFTLQITHRIDEDIDIERDYIVDTLRHADPAIGVEVIEDFSTAYHHRNGQGDRLRTDGDLPVVDLRGARARSDGATAMMLARHRPTGISVLRSRALDHRGVGRQLARVARPAVAPGEGRRGGSHRAELSGQLHDAVADIHDAFENVRDHHLPPPTVALTVLLVTAQAILVAAQWVALVLGHESTVLLHDVTALVTRHASLWQPTVVSAVSVLLVIGVLRRSRWSRLTLMALLTADALVRLIGASGLLHTTGEHGALALAGISVLGVMAISSDAARVWVLTSRESGARTARGGDQ